MNMIDSGVEVGGIPVYSTKVEYDEKLIRRSHRARENTYHNGEKLPSLEWGNAAIVYQFQLDKQLLDDMELWWEFKYSELGEEFNVELFTDLENNLIELRFMSKKCYYTSTKKTHNSVLNSIEESVLECHKMVPEVFTESCELIYLSDWDFIEYGEEEF